MTDYEKLLKSFIDPTEFSWKTKETLNVIKQDDAILKKDTIIPHTYELNDSDGCVFTGNVIVEGDLLVNAHTYIIGNLTVTGVIYGGIHSILMVAGDIDCRTMSFTRTYGFVTGNINIDQYAYFHDCGFMMLYGQLFTKLYINDDSWCNEDVVNNESQSFSHTIDNIKAEYLLEDTGDEGGTARLDKLKQILKEEAIQIEGNRINFFHPLDLISAGQTIFKND